MGFDLKKTLFVVAMMVLTSCGRESVVQDRATERGVSASLQQKADDYVTACIYAIDFGARVLHDECACIANSITSYIPEAGAAKFFDEITPLYYNEDHKRREDRIDRFFRDLIVGMTPEERPAWNAMFTDALPGCRALSGEDED